MYVKYSTSLKLSLEGRGARTSSGGCVSKCVSRWLVLDFFVTFCVKTKSKKINFIKKINSIEKEITNKTSLNLLLATKNNSTASKIRL